MSVLSENIDYTKTEDYHRFVDEAGDTTFYKKGKIPANFGENGISKYLILGMVHMKTPLKEANQKILDFGQRISQDKFFMAYPSVQKRIESFGFFLPHAKDDPAEIRFEFLKFLASEELSFSAQAVLGRKNFDRFSKAHNNKDREFYADLLAYILHDKANYQKLVINLAERGNSTSNSNLSLSLDRAKQRYKNRTSRDFKAVINFNIESYSHSPILSVVDYYLWAIQRLVERGDEKYYQLILDKIPHIYDAFAPKGQQRKFTRSSPLTFNAIKNRQ